MLLESAFGRMLAAIAIASAVEILAFAALPTRIVGETASPTCLSGIPARSISVGELNVLRQEVAGLSVEVTRPTAVRRAYFHRAPDRTTDGLYIRGSYLGLRLGDILRSVDGVATTSRARLERLSGANLTREPLELVVDRRGGREILCFAAS